MLRLVVYIPLLPLKSRGEPPSVPLLSGAIKSPLLFLLSAWAFSCVAFVTILAALPDQFSHQTSHFSPQQLSPTGHQKTDLRPRGARPPAQRRSCERLHHESRQYQTRGLARQRGGLYVDIRAIWVLFLCTVNGHQMLCDAHTVLEQHRGTAALCLSLWQSGSDILFLCFGAFKVCVNDLKRTAD